MKAQIYTLKTEFNFGKYKGKTLSSILKNEGYYYLGWLLINNIPTFILDPETIKILDRNSFFENLPLFSDHGATYTLSSMVNFTKEDLLSGQRKLYEKFQRDPVAYQNLIDNSLAEYKRKRDIEKKIEEDFIPDFSNVDFSNIQVIGSHLNPNENPWSEFLSDDEASAAYWNTD